MRTARRALTLTETVVAMLLASMLAVGVSGGLVFIGRAYRRDELAMARSQVAQQVFEALAEDLEHLSGTAMPTSHQLQKSGYEGSVQTLLSEPRRGANRVVSYTDHAHHETAVYELRYDERAMPVDSTWDYDGLTSHYMSKAPLKSPPPPWGIVKSAFLVPMPPDQPDVILLPLSTRLETKHETVLWAFWLKRRKAFEAGTILRCSDAETRVFTKMTPLIANVLLVNEWAHLKTSRSEALQPLDLRLDVDLRETNELALPFPEPEFRARRTLSAGL